MPRENRYACRSVSALKTAAIDLISFVTVSPLVVVRERDRYKAKNNFARISVSNAS
jgi:hypothetical protein